MGRNILQGSAVIALLVGVVVFAVTAYNGVPGRAYRELNVDVPLTGNLIKHDQVRIAGVRVGQVQSLSATRDGQTRLRIQLEPGTTIPVGTRAAIRANGLLGARFVQLLPGPGPANLRDGAVLKAGREALALGVSDALDVFDASTRRRLGPLVDALGEGVAGRGQALNTGLRNSGPATVPAQRLATAILSRGGAAERLLPAVDDTFTALDRARDPLTRLVRATTPALRPVVVKRDRTRETLRVAGPALSSVTDGLRTSQRLLGAARRLSVAANVVLPKADTGLRRTAILLRNAPAPLTRAGRLLDAARPAVPAVLDIGRALSPALRPLGATANELTPLTRTLGEYGCDVEAFAVMFRSMTGFGGYGSGPSGPPMGFRVQAIVNPVETAGITAGPDNYIREGYPKPCAFPSTTYGLGTKP